MESQDQFIVRHVVAQYLRSPDIDQAGREFVADRLEAGDPDIVAQLREDIRKSALEWSMKMDVVAVRHDGVHWRLRPKLVDGGADGPLVQLRWGWDEENGPSVTTNAEDAFDLAGEIIALFEDEDGEIQRPVRPAREVDDELSSGFEAFMEQAKAFMDALGDSSSCSMMEVKAWILSGRRCPVLAHDFVPYPEDKVVVCSVCGYYYHQDDDDQAMRACAGQPLLDGFPSIHVKNPLRTARLREAQRIDRIVQALQQVGGTQEEIAVFEGRFHIAFLLLDDADRERFKRERVGLGES